MNILDGEEQWNTEKSYEAKALFSTTVILYIKFNGAKSVQITLRSKLRLFFNQVTHPII